MLLAAYQTAFLPDITFLAKLVACDVMVLTDDFRYSTRAQINRCRIKTKCIIFGPFDVLYPVLLK